MLPGGVQSLLMCWYEPDRFKSSPLEHQRLLRRGKPLTTLVDGLRALKPVPKRGLPVNCPADFGANVLLIASYKQHGAVELLLDKTGCPTVTNGTLTRDLDAPLLSELDRLLPWPMRAPSRTPSTTS